MGVAMKKIYTFLYPYILSNSLRITGSIFLSLILVGSKTIYAYLMKPIIDRGIQSDTPLREVYFISGIIVGLGLLTFPTRFFHFYWIRYVVEEVTCKIRTRIYHKLQNIPLSYFQENNQGQLLSSLLNDTLIFSTGLLAMVNLIRESLLSLTLFTLILYRDWQLTLVLLALVPLFIGIFQKSGEKVRIAQGKAQEGIAKMTHDVNEGIQGQKVIKSFNIQDYVIKRFKRSQDFFFFSIMKTIKNEELAQPLIELVSSIGLASILLFAYHRISAGVMSSGDFISFIVAVVMLMDPIRKISYANIKLNQARAAGERIFKILSIIGEEDQGTLEKKTFDDKIEIKNITFSYGDSDVLKGFSLEVKRGEKVALVGLSGSGKSTLVSLFLRLYNIQKGEILIDGIPIQKLTLASLRSSFALVSQDTFLFNDTIKENISLGKEYKEKIFQEALHVSHCLKFIVQLPQKIETFIGDRGTRLSGGQAQRLTIARAYLRQNPILLFDEATSALDNESEKIVQNSLDKFFKGHTIIAVAHRLSTIQHFDNIVVLKDGIKVEQGTHEELIRKRGEYYKLYRLSS